MISILLSSLLYAEEPQPFGTLPSLQYAAPACYPDEALTQGKGASLLFEVLVDTQGEVVALNLLDSSDPAFNSCAVLAMQNYQFTPATDVNGTPVEAQIQYRFNFTPEEAPPLRLTGQVFEAGIRTPLEGILVTAIGPNGIRSTAQSDADGTFSFYGLQSGEWTFLTDETEFLNADVRKEISDSQVISLRFDLVRDQAKTLMQADDTIIVEARRETSEVSSQILDAEEIEYLPGSGGDIVKAVQNLPGIARAPLGIGQLIIRGTAPEDSAFYIDGSPIPDVFHFAGLTTVVSTANITEVLYLPGNFSVQYGRQLGGLVDIRTQDSFPERNSGFVSVDLYQSALFIEQRLNDSLALRISGRRSYADAILNPILNSAGGNFRTPRYYDFQANAAWKSSSGILLDGLFFLSDDRFSFSSMSEDEEEEVVNSAYSKNFQKFRLKLQQPLSNGWEHNAVFLFGPEKQDFAFQVTGEAYEILTAVNFRDEFSRDIGLEQNIGWKFGTDIVAGEYAFKYDVSSYSIGTPEEAELTFIYPSLYAENRWVYNSLEMISGIRGDAYFLEGGTQLFAADPRLASRWSVTDNFTFKAASGLNSQSPEPRELSAENDGNPELVPERSWHNVVGFQQDLRGGAITWGTSVYYNQLYNLVVGREDRFQFFTGPPPVGPFDTEEYSNEGSGRVYGLEGEFRYKDPTKLALVNASFSRSERVGRDGETRLFRYDQPFVVNALYSHLLPKNWRLGSRLRYGAGNPYTPVQNRIYDLNSRNFIPIYAERDSGRLPPFFSLDVRIDKDYVFRTWKLTTYLDIQNVTAQKNVELISWTNDYSEESPLQGNPTFPAFGFKGEW